MNLSGIKNILTQGATHFMNAGSTAVDYAKAHKVSNSLFAASLGVLGYGQYLKWEYTKAEDLIKKEIPAANTQLKTIDTFLKDKLKINPEDENKTIMQGTLEEIRDFLKDNTNFKDLSEKLTPAVLKARQEALKIVQGDIDSFGIVKMNETMVNIIDKVMDALQTAIDNKQLNDSGQDYANTLRPFLENLKGKCKATTVEELKEPFTILQAIADGNGNFKKIDALKNRQHLQQALAGLHSVQVIKDTLENAEEGGIARLVKQVKDKHQLAADFNSHCRQETTNRSGLLKDFANAVATALKTDEGLDKMDKEAKTFSGKKGSYMGNVKYIHGLASLTLSGGFFALFGNRIPAVARNFPSITQIG